VNGLARPRTAPAVLGPLAPVALNCSYFLAADCRRDVLRNLHCTSRSLPAPGLMVVVPALAANVCRRDARSDRVFWQCAIAGPALRAPLCAWARAACCWAIAFPMQRLGGTLARCRDADGFFRCLTCLTAGAEGRRLQCLQHATVPYLLLSGGAPGGCLSCLRALGRARRVLYIDIKAPCTRCSPPASQYRTQSTPVSLPCGRRGAHNVGSSGAQASWPWLWPSPRHRSLGAVAAHSSQQPLPKQRARFRRLHKDSALPHSSRRKNKNGPRAALRDGATMACGWMRACTTAGRSTDEGTA
jgi:hypothetical protein